MGFDAEWGVLSAADVGAPHRRERIWIVAKQRNILSHTQHNWTGWGQQLTQSTKKEDGKHPKRQPANTNLLGHKNGQIEKHTTKARLNAQRDISASSTDVANTKELFGNGSNNNAGSSMERKAQSKFGNNCGSQELAYAASLRLQGQGQHEQPIGAEKGGHWQANIAQSIGTSDQWTVEPNVGRVADGVAAMVDRLKAIGNGQVPLCAATAWRILREQ
jgi:DNA (cytosine-5)-methyltransferase 1